MASKSEYLKKYLRSKGPPKPRGPQPSNAGGLKLGSDDEPDPRVQSKTRGPGGLSRPRKKALFQVLRRGADGKKYLFKDLPEEEEHVADSDEEEVRVVGEDGQLLELCEADKKRVAELIAEQEGKGQLPQARGVPGILGGPLGASLGDPSERSKTNEGWKKAFTIEEPPGQTEGPLAAPTLRKSLGGNKDKGGADGDVSPPRRGRVRALSPTRRGRENNRDTDLSPPRRGRDGDRSPPSSGQRSLLPSRRGGGQRDMSPPRRGQDDDLSPPRRGRDGDPSPLHRGRDGDLSPPRRSRNGDLSPPRRGRDGDLSSRRGELDESSPARGGGEAFSLSRRGRDGDRTPPRRGRDTDLSPPRRVRPDLAPPSRGPDVDFSLPLRDREQRDPSLPRRRGPGPADERWGPCGAPESAEHRGPTRRESEAGSAKKVVFRDREGRIISEEEWLTLEGAKGRKRPRDRGPAPVLEWGSGLKQMQDKKSRKLEEENLAKQPFARYEIDDEYDAALKARDRWADPLANAPGRAKDKVDAEEEAASASDIKPQRPVCPHDAPPNRFGIKPGYRWDGVVRGNGYEEERIKMVNRRKWEAEMAHMNNTADM